VSTCWVTSRWSVFSVRRTSGKLRPFSKKTGAERPFRQAGEMWCGQDSNWGKGMEGSGSELRIEREDGAVLAASLTLPERRPAPASVALHGAQPGLRDDPLFHHLHAVLPPAGWAVVTFDRRGEGASTGEPSVGRFELLAADACAVLDALAARDDIDGRRIGFWGISQGGWVAPLAAVRGGRAAFLVLLSSCGVTPAEQMRYSTAERMRRAGYGEEAVRQMTTLLFYGEDDEWIPIDASIEAWRRARGDEGEIVRLPGTGHDATLASGEISPLYTETLIAWLPARFRRRPD